MLIKQGVEFFTLIPCFAVCINVIADLNGSSCLEPNGVNASVAVNVFVIDILSVFSSTLIYPLLPLIFISIVVCLVIPTLPANPVAIPNIFVIDLS